ncbi:hypothetical protein [Flavobacterium sp.]|uniref:hypothetical protein n=1 Tax=Flavobacterium sp. TaxID=239 RepID=UPI003341D796
MDSIIQFEVVTKVHILGLIGYIFPNFGSLYEFNKNLDGIPSGWHDFLYNLGTLNECNCEFYEKTL